MLTLRSASYSSAKEKQVGGFVYLSLVYDNNSTVKSIRKVLMSVMARHNESKRDNVGHGITIHFIPSIFLPPNAF